MENELDEKNLYALIVAEQAKEGYQNIELKQATENLQHLQNGVKQLQQQVVALTGAIEGIEVMVTRKLEEKGVSRETYQLQKQKYFEALGNNASDSKAGVEQPPAEA